MEEDDYYEVLDVARDASAADIRKAYRKLAIRWHPDKNPGNEEQAAERFKKIAEAYEVLSDEDRRQHYDAFGRDAPAGGAGGAAGAPSDGARAGFGDGGHGFHDPFEIFNAFFASQEDFLRDMGFGNFPGGAARGRGSDGGGARGSRAAGAAAGDPFGAPFGSPFGFGGGFGGFGGGPMGMAQQMQQMQAMMMGGMGGMGGMGMGGMGMGTMGGMAPMGGSFQSFSSSSSFGAGGTQRSTSRETYIDENGRRVTKTKTTVVHPDGRVEEHTDEQIDQARIGADAAGPPGQLGFQGF